jgi:hypothetical protein
MDGGFGIGQCTTFVSGLKHGQVKVPKGVNGGPSCGVPIQVGVGPEGGNSFVPRFLDEEDVRVVGLEDHVDASVAPSCVDRSYFDVVYCHI